MIVPLLLLLGSLAGAGFALNNPVWGDLLLLALPSALAALYLVIRAIDPWVRGGRAVIIDGSNVLHWADNKPDLKLVKTLVRGLSRQGLRAGVIFDANAGYKISSRYWDDADFARALRLPADRVLVVPKGTPADEYILEAARKLKARVISNDRFRDWKDRYPEVERAGFLLPGGVKAGKPFVVWGK